MGNCDVKPSAEVPCFLCPFVTTQESPLSRNAINMRVRSVCVCVWVGSLLWLKVSLEPRPKVMSRGGSSFLPVAGEQNESDEDEPVCSVCHGLCMLILLFP